MGFPREGFVDTQRGLCYTESRKDFTTQNPIPGGFLCFWEEVIEGFEVGEG